MDGVQANRTYFRIGTTQGLYFPSLVEIGAIVSEKMFKSRFVKLGLICIFSKK